MSISAGDTITASVMYLTSGAHAGQIKMTIADTSQTGDSFTTWNCRAARRSSAEWADEGAVVHVGYCHWPTSAR